MEKKMFNSKVFLAEFIGTFALVFVGTAAGILRDSFGLGLLGVALAHGFTLAVFVYAYGHISGTHVNPAVTFGMALSGVVKWGQAVFYWIAQFAGAILAAFLLSRILKDLGGTIDAGATVGALTEKFPIWAMAMEAILTFFLMNTILHTAVAGKGGRFAGWAIGTTLAIAIMVGGPFTGASLNPARTFGPAIILLPGSVSIYTFVIYLFGPLIGSTFAVIVYNFFNSSDETVEVEAEIVEVVETPAKAAKKPAARKTTKK
jgi:MIP family channel proteins